MATHSNKHTDEFLSQLIARCPGIVVDDVLFGYQSGQVIEEGRFRAFHHQIVSVCFVEEDDALVVIEPAARILRVRVGQDGRETTGPSRVWSCPFEVAISWGGTIWREKRIINALRWLARTLAMPTVCRGSVAVKDATLTRNRAPRGEHWIVHIREFLEDSSEYAADLIREAVGRLRINVLGHPLNRAGNNRFDSLDGFYK